MSYQIEALHQSGNVLLIHIIGNNPETLKRNTDELDEDDSVLEYTIYFEEEEEKNE